MPVTSRAVVGHRDLRLGEDIECRLAALDDLAGTQTEPDAEIIILDVVDLDRHARNGSGSESS